MAFATSLAVVKRSSLKLIKKRSGTDLYELGDFVKNSLIEDNFIFSNNAEIKVKQLEKLKNASEGIEKFIAFIKKIDDEILLINGKEYVIVEDTENIETATTMKISSNGNRILKDFKVQNEQNFRKEEAENKFAEESKKFQENVNQTIESLKNEFSGKEKDLIEAYKIKIEELNQIISNTQPVKQGAYDGIEVKIISNYTEHEVKLPNKEALIGMGVGARIVTSTVDGSKMIGLKVTDILYDCVSDFNGKPIIEIIVDKE